MSRRILITGATGALGQALVSRLLVDPCEFMIFAPGRRDNDDALDLLERGQIVHAIDRIRPDLILHLAASFAHDFDEAYGVNVAATRFLLEAVKAADQPVRIVLIGSAAEYGAVSVNENPIGEEHVLRPISVYGITKAWQTELAYLYASRGVDVVVARIFNLTGPNLSERLFIGRLHKQIAELQRGERSQIEVGPLSALRDYLSTDDAVTQLLVIAKFGDAGKVYHVASGRPISMREMLIRELAAYGLDESIVVEEVGFTNRSGYDVPVIYANMKRTNALLQKWGKHAQN